jgi:group I intron endonuclease
METKIYIYSLSDPRTNEVRYIGKSVNPKRRLNEHLKKFTGSHKSNWIKSLLNIGLMPIIEIVEICNDSNWCEREKYWISQFGNLTNGTEGGEDGRMLSSVRKRMSIINSGVNNPNYGKKASEETRKKISESLINRNLSKEHKNAIKKSVYSVRILVNNKLYESYKDAEKDLNIHATTVYRRCLSNNFPEYKIL